MAFSTIIKPSDYFNTKLYTGNFSTNAITGVGFQPDLTWIKSRTTAGEDHYLFDAIRGVTNYIHSNTTAAQSSNAATLTTFGSDGFTVGANNSVNKSSDSLVAWNWKANGQGSSNTDGSINTTYTSANTTSGFSISQYTGTGSNATVGHGLGVAPKMIIFKNTNTATNWDVFHGSLANTQRLFLDESGAATTAANAFNSTSPTTAVFSVGTADNTNKSSSPMIAYCFADVQGFSKFGSYTGLGATTGAFVYTGFKPSFVMTKIATTGGSDTGGWVMVDNKSYPNNLANSPVLFANLNNAQNDAYNAEFFSNGFSFNANSVTVNGAGNTYSYMAFAETPFVANSGQSIPTTAR